MESIESDLVSGSTTAAAAAVTTAAVGAAEVVDGGGAVVTAVTATLVVPPAVTTCIIPPDSISRFRTRARLKSVSTLGGKRRVSIRSEVTKTMKQILTKLHHHTLLSAANHKLSCQCQKFSILGREKIVLLVTHFSECSDNNNKNI